MGDTVGILDIIKALGKRWKLIAVLTLSAVMVTGVVSFYFLKPVYNASTQILVNQKNKENQLDYSLLNRNVELINTYSGIIKSPAILEKVKIKLGLTISWEELNQKITVTSQDKSQIFSVMVKDANASKAVEFANTVSETFQEEIKHIMSVDNVSILARAELKENPTPVSPKPVINIVMAMVIGLMLGAGISLLIEFLDSTLKNEQDVAACLGIPVLGSIQKISKAEKKGHRELLIKNKGGESIVAPVEKYR